MSHKGALGSKPELRLDRLVDGELSAPEYRALLAALDEQPDGWRRCAMAFLEDQALGQELCRLRDRAGVDPSARFELSRARGGSSPRWLSLMATAALVALAFGLGWSFRRPAPIVAPALPVADNSAAAPTTAVAQNEGGKQPEALPAGTEGSVPAVRPLGNVTLVVDSEDGTTRELELPVFPLEARYANWLMSAEPGVPPEVQRALRYLGYEVRRNRRVAPVETPGDHRLFVPMEQVEITPVASRSFQ